MRYFLIFLVLFTAISFAQTGEGKITERLSGAISTTNSNEEILIWVFFTDKGNNTARYFANPLTVVSEKSLKRRAKVLDENNLISEMDLPVNQHYINRLNELGFVVKQKTKWFNGVSGYFKSGNITQLAELNFIKKLDVVQKYKTDYTNPEMENDGSGKQKEEINKQESTSSFNYGPSFTQLNQIQVPAVHDLGYTGSGITIGMMDAGFDRLSHQVFSSMNIIATWDFVNGDPNVENQGDMGDGSHGTSTLSTIGGFFEGELIGPAFNSDYILMKTENTESETPVEEDNWIAALEWADSIGVDVTSTSLTYLDYDPPFQSYTWEDMDGNTALITIAADLAVKIGIFVANSAGNSGWNSHNTLGAPADGDSVVAVGSVNSDGSRSSFSSVGPTVDGRYKPDLMAMGSGVYVARNWSNTSYGTSSGTSFSCPLLAGCAALLLEVDPSLTPIQLRELMKNTASQSSSPDNLMGWGIINTLEAAQSLLTNTENSEQPEDFYILRNYPNPFNPSTTIQFSIPEQANVKITLHDVLGRELDVLFNDVVNPGLHDVTLTADNLSSGVYLVRMNAGNTQKTLKISLLK